MWTRFTSSWNWSDLSSVSTEWGKSPCNTRVIKHSARNVSPSCHFRWQLCSIACTFAHVLTLCGGTYLRSEVFVSRRRSVEALSTEYGKKLRRFWTSLRVGWWIVWGRLEQCAGMAGNIEAMHFLNKIPCNMFFQWWQLSHYTTKFNCII